MPKHLKLLSAQSTPIAQIISLTFNTEPLLSIKVITVPCKYHLKTYKPTIPQAVTMYVLTFH